MRAPTPLPRAGRSFRHRAVSAESFGGSCARLLLTLSSAHAYIASSDRDTPGAGVRGSRKEPRVLQPQVGPRWDPSLAYLYTEPRGVPSSSIPSQHFLLALLTFSPYDPLHAAPTPTRAALSIAYLPAGFHPARVVPSVKRSLDFRQSRTANRA